MRIVVLCATRRGYLFLERLTTLLPQGELVVFSFREEPWEPPFLDDIRGLALSYGGQFFEAKQVGGQRLSSFWSSTEIDLMLVVSWRYMIPASIFRSPRLGTFVYHDALLPEYRGFAPTVWAIVNGEDHTGVSLFEIAEEVDAGDVIDQQRVPIGPDEPIGVVMDRVTQTYLALLERNLGRLLDGTAPRHVQDHQRATFTCKRLPEDSRINWAAPSQRIYNLIRASSAPYPGALSTLDGQRLRVWAARPLPDFRRYVGAIPGRVVEVRPGEGSVLLTGDGALLLTEVELDYGGPVCAADVLNSPSQTLR